MTTDLYGLPITSNTDATTQAINDFIHGFISYHPKAAGIVAAADADRSCRLANTYAGMLWMFLEAPGANAKAQIYLDRAAELDGTAREKMVTQAVQAWANDDIPKCVALCDQITSDHPRDLTILKLAQYHTFNAGDAAAMLRMALKGLPAAADIPYTHGMLAFGYEQCHLLDEAEASARHAMRLQHNEPWAHHAIAHVMLTQGRVDEGIAFLESVADTWADLNSFMHTHNWWHLALFYISKGRHADVLKTFDTHVWGISKDYSQDQVGAASLLARMEFAGVDVGDRWTDLANHIAARGADTVNPFLTMQYLYALGRAKRPEAEALLQAVETRAADASRHDQIAWAEVALPACKGIMAHTKGDWESCIKHLGQALPRMQETGGSHAQRDLFEQIHLDALIKAGRASTAQQVLEMRRTYDPDGVPLNMMLAEVYETVGLPSLAQSAKQRAEAFANT